MSNNVDLKDTEVKKSDRGPGDDLVVKGRFNRYNSPFLQVMMPLLTTRYLWLAIEDINPLNFLKKPNPALQAGFEPWKKPGFLGYLSRNFAALGMGATTLGVMAYYSRRTYEDMHTLYSEAVGYELNKKPQDVDINDLFQSKNAALEVTRNAFVKRTLTRLATGGAFFLPWHSLRDWKNAKPKYDANANAGVGAIGLYLSLDGFIRKPTFFEAEQNMVAESINNNNEGTHEVMQAKNIQSLLMLQRRHLNPNYKWPKSQTEEGQNEAQLAERITELMNQTYKNKPNVENANLTLGKFNYLVGFGLLESFPTSLAFVELANKSKDMQEVKDVAAAIKGGQPPAVAFQKYGIDVSQVSAKRATLPQVENTVTLFTDKIHSVKERSPQLARSHQDFAAQVPDPNSPYIG